MKKAAFILTAFVLLTQFFSCRKNPKCWGDDKHKGIIKTSLGGICFPKDNNAETFVILDQDTYQKTFDSTCIAQLPNIDFNTETLLGMYVTGQCNVKFIREVTSISNENKYHYKVTVKQCGLCKSMAFSYNWVTVPKLPNGWTVTFEVKDK
ncbi:MAG: hypothetical protein KF900_12950 [Bacteroidetes bacterium]|nr:hypothetical protein [Bacteroidota bacterium]